ncbi:MAG: type III-B CRISPR-associated protein Cas10/Cmr2 [Anaerolineae bacterium]|nr:type III-B CRISPR-associated protein Cas10/Cmr2 [Anaerolineae bacterium]MDW8068810.1 type III-B CRISPR-associated protein Cas10/Cmr2 [Anaerolineae bacterium]
MPDRVFIFSLGPVQGFLAEARRAQDLWAGSQLLSELARAAIRASQGRGAKVIYPADPDQESLPNKFVVRLPESVDPEEVARTAMKSALEALKERAERAKEFLRGISPGDGTWDAIWQRQLENHLEFFWAAATIAEGYQAAYQRASRAFEAAKRTRPFPQTQEEDLKDSLSGRRSALHTAQKDARAYWKQIATSGKVTAAQLKPDGRERLDALGAIKRFGFGSDAERFPSTSSVAAADYLAKVLGHPALEIYRKTLEAIPLFYRVSEDDRWPYDGDLLYLETLASQRLQASYGFREEHLTRYKEQLEDARQSLRALYSVAGRPSPYYALLVMDGDSIGKRIARCASEEEHRTLSQQMVEFAMQAREILKPYQGTAVYAGGDDILALLPLRGALPAAQALAESFAQKVPQGTASAGLVLAHHLYPLGAVLSAGREAESWAKRMEGKNAVCVRALKRSGEPIEVRSHWGNPGKLCGALCQWFASGALASRFAYEVAANLPFLKGELVRSELKRLIRRHRNADKPDPPDPTDLADRLAAWAESLPGGAEELAGWLLLARFIAQGGGE